MSISYASNDAASAYPLGCVRRSERIRRKQSRRRGSCASAMCTTVAFKQSQPAFDVRDGAGPECNVQFSHALVWPGTITDVKRRLGLLDATVVHIALAQLPRLRDCFRRILSLLRTQPSGYADAASLLAYEILITTSREIHGMPRSTTFHLW